MKAKTIKCFWCKTKATVKDYREIDGTTGSYPSCSECFNLSTEYLLKREHETCPKYNEQALPDDDGNCSLCGKHKVL